MAVQYAHDMDLLDIFQLIRARAQNLAADPSGLGAGAAGRFWFNTTSGKLKVWNGTAVIDLLDLANSTGSLLAVRISDFNAAARLNRLDQFTAPTGPVGLNGQKITSMADGTANSDGANYGQLLAVQALAASAASGVAYKAAVRAVDTVGVTQSGAQTVDGVALTAGQRYLRAVGSDVANGLWVVNAGAHTRAPDADVTGELAPGTQVGVTEGASPASEGGNADSIWRLVSDAAITIGTTAQTWERLPGSGATTYLAGLGLTLTGTTFDVGEGEGIDVTANAVAIDTTRVRRKITGTVPTATGTVSGITVTVTGSTVAFAHGLANPCTRPEFVYGSSPGAGNTQGQPIFPDYTNDAAGNNTTVVFPGAPGANQYIFDLDG